MGRAHFRSKRLVFKNKNDAFKNVLRGKVAMDTEIVLKTSVGMPVLHGQMKASTRHQQNPDGSFRVIIPKSYAAYQERGARADGSHMIRRHSTPGTSAHFFLRAIQVVSRNKETYAREAAKAVGL